MQDPQASEFGDRAKSRLHGRLKEATVKNDEQKVVVKNTGDAKRGEFSDFAALRYAGPTGNTLPSWPQHQSHRRDSRLRYGSVLKPHLQTNRTLGIT